MQEWMFEAAVLVAASFVIFNGVLMLAAPAKHRRFLALMSRDISSQPRVRQENRRGPEIERRLVGIGLIWMGVYLARHEILHATSSHRLAPPLRS